GVIECIAPCDFGVLVSDHWRGVGLAAGWLTSHSACSVAAWLLSRSRCRATVARQPQGPSWARCMRGADARNIASARPKIWVAVCSLSPPLQIVSCKLGPGGSPQTPLQTGWHHDAPL